MIKYQAPAIIGTTTLDGALSEVGSNPVKEISDAEIKHNVQSTDTYQAPGITNTADLDGALDDLGSPYIKPQSDAEIKHNVQSTDAS